MLNQVIMSANNIYTSFLKIIKTCKKIEIIIEPKPKPIPMEAYGFKKNDDAWYERNGGFSQKFYEIIKKAIIPQNHKSLEKIIEIGLEFYTLFKNK